MLKDPIFSAALAALTLNEASYCEPYVGGGSVAIYVARLRPGMRIVLNDKDPLIASMWRVIVGGKSGLKDLIGLLDTNPSVELWRKIQQSDPTTDVERAFKAIFLNRTTHHGRIEGSSPIGGFGQEEGKKWRIDCRYKPQLIAATLIRYNSLLAGRAEVFCEDALEVMSERENMPMFLDPPYFVGDKTKSCLYRINMTANEHEKLAEFLVRCRKWLITYDDSDNTRKELYRGVTRRILDVRYSMTTTHSKKWKDETEVVAYRGFSFGT